MSVKLIISDSFTLTHFNLQSQATFLFRSWINGPDGAKKILGSFPFVEIENRPAPLSFVKLSLSAQIYYFWQTNLGAVNHSAKLRFEEFAYRVMAEARQCRATEIFKLGGKVYAFESSTIDLCLSVFSWALFRKKKGGIKLHTLYDFETQIPTFFHITPARNHDTRAMDAIPYEENSFYIFDRAYNDFGRLFTIDGVGAYFVVRGKKNNDIKPMRWKRRLPAGVMSDAVGYMDGQLTMSKYPEKIRRILYLDTESGRTFIFFTNALNINPLKVAELYHNRWQIELFFKWLKQLLKVKKFWGQTENAVRIQIYTAVTAYCMMAIVQKKMDVQRSIYEMLQLVSVSLTDTVELKTLFCKPNCNIVNEPDGSTEPTLF